MVINFSKNIASQKISISKATSNDSRCIWEWRNDDVTRKMSLDQTCISWNEHCNWFKKILANPNHFLYIGLLNHKEKFGMCRFDIDSEKNMAEISINLNPRYRNRKLSLPFLAEAIKKFNAEKSVILLNATIKKNNQTSINCFKKFGFKLKDEKSEYFQYQYHN